MTNITNVSIVGDEIFVYRRFILHRYKNSWRRAAMLRRAIIGNYLYQGVLKWDIEQYRINGPLPKRRPPDDCPHCGGTGYIVIDGELWGTCNHE